MKLVLAVVAGLAGAAYLSSKGFAATRKAHRIYRQYNLVSARDGHAV